MFAHAPARARLAALRLGEETCQILRVFFFFGCHFLQQAPGRRIVTANVLNHLAIAVDGDSFGDEVLPGTAPARRPRAGGEVPDDKRSSGDPGPPGREAEEVPGSG